MAKYRPSILQLHSTEKHRCFCSYSTFKLNHVSRLSCEVLEKYNLCHFSISSLVEQNHTIFRAERYTTMHVCAQLLSCVQLLATPWTVAHQAPPSMGFSRQGYWSGVPLPSLLNSSSYENCTKVLQFMFSTRPYLDNHFFQF